MKRLSATNMALFIINLFVIIFSYVMFLVNEFDWITFNFAIAMPIYYIFMNRLTIKSLDDNWLVLYNAITLLSVMLMLLGVLSGVFPFEALGISMLVLLLLNIIYLIADLRNINSPKENELNKESMTTLQDSNPNIQFTKPTNNQPIIQAQNEKILVDEHNVEDMQDDKVEVNNITIDLNKLTSEQKDLLLKILITDSHNK